MFISHHHNHRDGYRNLESLEENESGRASSLDDPHETSFTIQDVETLAERSERVTVTPEVKAYLHNLIVFLRLHRVVAKGVSPMATIHLELLSRYALLANDNRINLLMRLGH